jgi:hypothetical protein
VVFADGGKKGFHGERRKNEHVMILLQEAGVQEQGLDVVVFLAQNPGSRGF